MKHVHKAARTVEICECGARHAEDGTWVEEPDFSEFGHALSRRYLKKATPEQLRERSLKAAESRWKGKARERDKYMREIAQRPRPSRLIPDRCPCGKYSKYLAKKRNHKCAPNHKS